MFNECQLNLNTAELWFLRIARLQLVRGAPRPPGPPISLLSFIVTRACPRPRVAAEISIGLQLQLKHRHQVMTPHLPILQSLDDKQSQDKIQMQFVSDILKLSLSSF